MLFYSLLRQNQISRIWTTLFSTPYVYNLDTDAVRTNYNFNIHH